MAVAQAVDLERVEVKAQVRSAAMVQAQSEGNHVAMDHLRDLAQKMAHPAVSAATVQAQAKARALSRAVSAQVAAAVVADVAAS